jgi:hypothetical protein
MSVFISHTHVDKALVEPFALRLADVVGKDAVFYDSWAIQPGDGIIDKMNEALGACRHFFFFVTKQSIQSKMVQLEWQNALLKATKGEAKLIPVRLDDCLMPPVLRQTLYVDAFVNGFETALRQMVDVVQGANTFRAEGDGSFQNVRAYVTGSLRKLTVEFRAEAYMEPHSRYLILMTNQEAEVSWKAPGEGIFEAGFHVDAATNGLMKLNALLIARSTPTSPGFPFVAEIEAKAEAPLGFMGAMRIVARDKFENVPVILSLGT